MLLTVCKYTADFSCLNLLPLKKPTNAQYNASWAVRWPAICLILFELDHIFHNEEVPPAPPNIGTSLVEWLQSVSTSVNSLLLIRSFSAFQNTLIDEEEAANDEKAEESTTYRSCSASFTSIIRKDLSKNVRLAFVDTVNKTHNQFALENGKIQFVPREVQSLASLLPANYLEKDVLVPRPLDRQFLQNDDLEEEFNALFHEVYFDQIHSAYFGSKVISKSTLNAARFHLAIVYALESDKDNFYSGLSSHVMKMARNVYVTNFANMWADNTIVNRVLNKPSETLLIVHLSPARDQIKKSVKSLKGEERVRTKSLQTTIVLPQYTRCHSSIKPTKGAEGFLL
ncbi:hypothetical protein [Parasitella parasitica]|uniref:Uncharacterized protein n=1 Tax=Parasitella parasitica TaxID=35722 RepID=A0A0B7MQ85_9FUNG|nr:hypothetical protein [Parasitella parasitica]